MAHEHAHTHEGSHDRTVRVKVKRQESPSSGSYWETFELPYEKGLNITSVLQRIAANPQPAGAAESSTPVAYDSNCLEELCGACSMVINGRVRQGCTALVDSLLADGRTDITLEPMTKFPVIRDLVVDRSRFFADLKRAHAWIDVDGYYDRGPGPKMIPQVQDDAYPLSRCMTCGCCMEACPNYGERSPFIGPAVVSQIIYFNAHPTGASAADARLAVLTAEGGIAGCGNAQNCVKVCPKDIPLTTSIAKAGWEATKFAIRRWFTR